MKCFSINGLSIVAVLLVTKSVRSVNPSDVIEDGLSNEVKRNLESAQLLCPNTHGSSITLTTGAQKYVLSVPADGTKYDVVGPDSILECVGPIGTKYSMCQACNFPVQLIQTNVEAGLCAFNFSGFNDLVYLNHESGPYPLSTPTQILDVTCGLNPRSSLNSRYVQPDIRSAPVACPAWTDNTTIRLVSSDSDSSVRYDLQIRPDGNRFQLDIPPYSAGCIRRDKLYTDQCFPCDMNLTTITVEAGISCAFETYIGDHEHYWDIQTQGLVEVDLMHSLKIASVTCRRSSNSTGWASIKSRVHDVAAPPSLLSRDNAKMLTAAKYVKPQNNSIQFYNGNQLAGCLVVPADMQYYTLTGESPAFECEFYGHNRTSRSGPCSDFAWKYVYVHEALEECRFQIEGWNELYVWRADFRTPQRFDNPVKILGVQCGFGQRNNPPRIAYRSTGQPLVSSDEIVHLWSRQLSNTSQPENWVLFWNSDGWSSTVQVPADKQYYNLSGSDPQLTCYYLSETYYPLHSVHSCSDWTWQYVQVVGKALGECQLSFNGADKPYASYYGNVTITPFFPPVQVLGIQCGFGQDNSYRVITNNATGQPELVGPGLVNRTSVKSRRDLAASQSKPECKSGDGKITLTQSTGEDHIIHVSADRAMHPVSTLGEGIGCEGAVSGGCFVCGTNYLTVAISTSLDTCIFSSFKTGMNIIVSSNASRIIQNGILRPYDGFSSLVCGFDYSQIPDYLFPQPGHPNELPRSRDSASESRDLVAPVSEAPQCQGLTYKVSIQTVDGNVYFAPVPLDYKFHSMSEMSCVRVPDAACVPCNEIGPTISVDTAVQWGPCIFFTEDHRAFFTQYWNSAPDGGQATPLTPFDPAGVISGIECGSGA